MKRLVLTTLLIFGIINQTVASTTSNLKQKQSNINKEKSAIQEKLKETTDQKTLTSEEILIIDSNLEIATNELYAIESQLKNTETLFYNTQKSLEETILSKEHHDQVLRKRVKYVHENGNIGFLSLLLEATSFSDFIKRAEYVNIIMKHDKKIFEEYEEIQKEISTKVAQISLQKDSIQALKYEQASKQEALKISLKEKEDLILRLDADEEKYLEQINELEKASQEIEKAIKKAELELKLKREAALRNNSFSTSQKWTGGKLLWPVSNNYNISSGYGKRINPISRRGEFHTGIDIPAKTGTSVLAAADGTVISSGWIGGYGNTLILSHGDGISTLYAHNSKLLVSSGKEVKKGDIIAKIGSTGYSTGPHLHFEVRINGSHVGPTSYLK